ncbi:hypothetical protein PTSG_08948 [Salpingoeca rosetta]|uniref:Uncharacterized protein n=1 Tax=Salpingoeca rosetta (strain ATCC 50818 / BSB-021) TaxID=946362 RepID=F2ULS0_SALR5|nr:uncharacterized protein PTSG_08948 [Salpingoeca rosetta]EGD78069.1 hypothetical protein PTSG_08948 [Salpingoeca rosetta]|eukprot:XP_004989745.1 hypothetical protein PTSG_08948 [Salpingoeca rosetta]
MSKTGPPVLKLVDFGYATTVTRTAAQPQAEEKAEEAMSHEWLMPSQQPSLDHPPLPLPTVLRQNYGVPRKLSRERVVDDALELHLPDLSVAASSSSILQHQSA